VKRQRPITPADRAALKQLVDKYGPATIRRLIPIVRPGKRGRPPSGTRPQREAARFAIEVDKLAKKMSIKQALFEVHDRHNPGSSITEGAHRKRLYMGRKYLNEHPGEFK
jgi:hypothetical protein